MQHKVNGGFFQKVISNRKIASIELVEEQLFYNRKLSNKNYQI